MLVKHFLEELFKLFTKKINFFSNKINDDYNKIGIALVQTIQESHMLAKHFENQEQLSEKWKIYFYS